MCIYVHTHIYMLSWYYAFQSDFLAIYLQSVSTIECCRQPVYSIPATQRLHLLHLLKAILNTSTPERYINK